MNAKQLYNTNNPRLLSEDPETISSLVYVQRAGFWAALVGTFAIVSSLFRYAMLDPNQIDSLGYIALSILLTLMIGGWYIYSGFTLNNLPASSTTKRHLIINGLISIPIVWGVFPILMIILSLVALFKFNNYRIWAENSGLEAIYQPVINSAPKEETLTETLNSDDTPTSHYSDPKENTPIPQDNTPVIITLCALLTLGILIFTAS